MWRKFVFTWVLLCVAKFSKTSMKHDTKSRGLGTQRKMEFYLKLDKIDTAIGMWFPIHVVASVSLIFSSSSQIDSKLKLVRFARENLVVCKKDTKWVKFVKQCFTDLIYVFEENMPNSFLASCPTPLQVSSFILIIFTRWATISFKKIIDLG